MRIQGEASAARESIMKGRNVLTDEDEATTTSRRVAVAFAVAVYDPAKHPSRSRSPCSGLRVVAPRRVRPRLAHRVTYYVARSSIVLSHSHHLQPAPAHHPSSAPRRRSTLSPPPLLRRPLLLRRAQPRSRSCSYRLRPLCSASMTPMAGRGRT